MRYGSKPYWFGLGFLQLKLSDTERMHFWLPEIPHPEREEIHNHRYNFHSQVLAGALYHSVYHLDATIESLCGIETEWELFETNCEPGKTGTVETVTPCLMTHVGDFWLEAGSLYQFPHTSYHTTEGTNFAITHLTRKYRVVPYANVVKKSGAPSTCPFEEQIPEKRCWDYIDHALQRALCELNEMTSSIPCAGCGRPSGSFGPMSPNAIYRCIHCSTD